MVFLIDETNFATFISVLSPLYIRLHKSATASENESEIAWGSPLTISENLKVNCLPLAVVI